MNMSENMQHLIKYIIKIKLNVYYLLLFFIKKNKRIKIFFFFLIKLFKY